MTSVPRSPGDRQRLLAIYLNDHLAGATGGVSLAERLESSHRHSGIHVELQRIAAEVDADRESLLSIMRDLDVPVTHYKLGAAWLAERFGRLKPNGRVRERSPLSSLVELEMMQLGVEGKASGWRTLRTIADGDARLDADRLDTLLARAQEQADTVERLRVDVAAQVLGSPGTDAAG